MIIRKLTTADAPAFRDLRIEMCRDHPEAFGHTPEEVAALQDDKYLEWITPSEVYPEKFVLAAFEGDRMLGTVGFKREDSFKERHRGWIWTVYVRPEARGRGISKKLMQQIIDDSRKMEGLEMLTLTVAVPQTSARTLYTALGFYTTGLNIHGYKLPDGSYVDHEEMVLWL
ncbi:MAG: GNAT family N-acetyltransferase [Candidatus Zixiibacteriota bacterium]